MARLNFF